MINSYGLPFGSRIHVGTVSPPMSNQLFTIGHSTHSEERFLELLLQHGIQVLADIRRFPGSRKFPQFNQEHLASFLPAHGIEYRWIQDLGGRREKTGGGEPSKNLGLRNESFRNYADYMATESFRAGIQELLKDAENKPTAFMCSESLFWRCHRRLVSDYLLTTGHFIQHILPNGKLQPHTLTEGAKVEHGELIYPAAGFGQKQLFE
jgi:uncharacterized protein (DUF488 family)